MLLTSEANASFVVTRISN